MGRDTVEFGSNELRIVGGDYGRIELEGTTAEARGALDQVVAADRRGGGRTVIAYFQLEYDDSPDLFEDRHAGNEGTPQREHAAGPGSTDDQSGAAESASDRPSSGVE